MLWFGLYCHTMQRRQWHPTPVLLIGESHGRSNSPWGRYESDTTERLHFHFSLSCIGEGNGNPLQRSWLENPRDRGAWWAAIYGVAQSRTRLKRLSSSSRSSHMMNFLLFELIFSGREIILWEFLKSWIEHIFSSKKISWRMTKMVEQEDFDPDSSHRHTKITTVYKTTINKKLKPIKKIVYNQIYKKKKHTKWAGVWIRSRVKTNNLGCCCCC